MHLSRTDIKARYRINNAQLSHLLADPSFPQPIQLATHAVRWPLEAIERWEKDHTTDRPYPHTISLDARFWEKVWKGSFETNSSHADHEEQWRLYHQYRSAIFAAMISRYSLAEIASMQAEAIEVEDRPGAEHLVGIGRVIAYADALAHQIMPPPDETPPESRS